MQTQSSRHGSNLFRIAVLSLSLFAGLVCGGCLSKPALKRQTFAFDNPPPAAASQTGGVVLVKPVVLSPLFERQAFVYRTSAEAYETDPYAGFLIAPNRAIGIAIREHLLGSGQFQDVVAPGMRKPDKIIEVYVTELYGDFSKPDQSAAVLGMRVSVTSADMGSPMQRSYSQRVPLEKNTAAAVMAGWNQALKEIMAQVVIQASTAR